MIRIVTFNFGGNMFPLFLDDTDTGYTGKDVLTKPGVYEEITSDTFTLPIAELSGAIDGYATKLMGLIANQDPSDSDPKEIMDYTAKVKQLLAVPETAAKMLMEREPQDMRDFLRGALETIHYYESVTEDTKVFLPEAAFEYVDEAVAKKMRSTRHVYVLKNSENQEIIQKTYTDVYGIVLPSVDDLHSDMEVSPNALDILRVVAPCRKEVSPGIFTYNGIYHTPYFRVDPRLRGSLPSYLKFLNGYSRNDNLPIQQYERHMYDNLFMFINSDVARCVSQLYTGIFLQTLLGQKLKRLISCRNAELFGQLVSDLAVAKMDGVTCDITYTDVQSTVSTGINSDELAKLVQSKISVTVDALIEMAENQVKLNRVVDIENLPFVLDIGDEDKDRLTEFLHQKSIITRAMFEYLLQLCCKAYAVNWGHTGATRAIPRFVSKTAINTVNEAMATHLNSKLGKAAPNPAITSLLYPNTFRPDDSDDSDAGDDDDEIFTDFDYYITDSTRQLMRDGQLDVGFIVNKATGAESSESSVVEYWRKVNGENNLRYFLTDTFMSQGALQVFLEAFYKLMRWGDNKPALLVFDSMPEVRTVFDLNVGKEIPNTAIVDESQLVMVNGCRHTLSGVLTARDVVGSDEAIVGFLLCRDYGIKKYYMASLVDIGEMVCNGEIDVAEFKGMSQVQLTGENVIDITTLADTDYSLYVSNTNIEAGLASGTMPAQLSTLALLLQAGVTKSAEYLKSKQTTVVITTKDRQYQILSSYIDVLRTVYERNGDVLRRPTATTVELSAIATEAYQLYHEGVKLQAPDVNTVRAQSAIASMNLDAGSVIQYSDAPLNGKFIIVSDADGASGITPITFTDANMARLSERLHNSIVLLMLELQDEYLLCRKDILQSELLIHDRTIEHRKYSVIAPVLDGLKQGKAIRISDAKTGNKKVAKLHRSLEGFV